MIKTENISLSYGEISVLKEISINIKEGEFVSIVGDSGAGKTSLLQILGTLENSQETSSKLIRHMTVISTFRKKKFLNKCLQKLVFKIF